MVGQAPGSWKVKLDASILSFPETYKEVYEVDNLPYARFKDGVVRDMLIVVHYELPTPP